MKIVDIAVLPLTAPYLIAGLPPDDPQNGVRNCVWVRITTDEGISGWGEVYLGAYATEVTVSALRRLVRGLDGATLTDPVALLEELRFRNRYWAMRGIGAQSTSAIEAALWDIVGQAQGQPVWRLLRQGDAHAEPSPVLLYASDGSYELSPQQIYDETKAYVTQGYRAYKMRCGGPVLDFVDDRLALDTERVQAARAALGPERLLFVDVAVPQRPKPWPSGRAEAFMEAFLPYQVRFIEEPAMTYDWRRYRELQAMRLILTAGGESFACPEEFEPFFEAGALGVAQPDAAVVGGPASCVEVGKRAAELGVDVCLHCFSAGVGIAQNLHAACAIPGLLAMEGPQAIHPLATEPLCDIWHWEDGFLLPPTLPGLGVNIPDELLTRCVHQPDSERDW